MRDFACASCVGLMLWAAAMGADAVVMFCGAATVLALHMTRKGAK